MSSDSDPPNESGVSESSQSLFTTIGKVRALKPPREITRKVFLSYRRSDSAGHAGRLFDRLGDRFGKEHLFMDVAAIEAGADFVDAIEAAVGSCEVLVVLIGPRWLEAADADGNRRIDDPEDFVRLEILAGLEYGRPVIPVLVDGARMPGFDDLPEALAGLARRNAIEISNSRWDYDVERLLTAITDLGVEPQRRGFGAGAGRGGPGSVVAAAVAVLLLAGGAWWWSRSGGEAAPPAARSGPPVAEKAPIEVRPSLAVAGLVAKEDSEEAEWLETALAEMIETGLGLGDQVRTVGGTEVAEARRSLGLPEEGLLPSEDLVRLAKALGVDYLIEGTFERSGGDLLRIEVDLRRGGDGTAAAEGKTTGTSAQLFDVVSRALRSVREALEIEDLSPADALVLKAALPRSPEATRLYAEGLGALRDWDAPTARDRFERAVRIEPDHPLPHSGLAQAWEGLGYLEKAEAEATRAVELAGDLSEPSQLLLEAQAAELASDWPLAIRRYEELLERYPDDLVIGLALADLQVSHGETAEALGILDDLEALPDPLGADPGIALMRARAAFRTSAFDAAITSATEAIDMGERLGASLVSARGRLWRGASRQEIGDKESAFQDLDDALAVFQRTGDSRSAALVLERRALDAYRTGDYDGAERLYRRLVALWEEAGNRRMEAIYLANIGKLDRERGRFRTSRQALERALVVARELEAGYEVGQFLNELATLEFLTGDLESASRAYEGALSTFLGIGDLEGQAFVLTNLGEIAFLQSSLDVAEARHEEALALNREIGDAVGVAYDTFRLGLVDLFRGQITVASQRLGEALKSFEQQRAPVSTAEVNLALARLALEESRFEEASKRAGGAREYFASEGLTDLEARAGALHARALAGSRSPESLDVILEVGRLVETSEDMQARVAELLAAVEVSIGIGAPTDGLLERVDRMVEETAERGLELSRLELLIARGRIEVAEGDVEPGRGTYRKVEREATELGALLLARRAVSLLEGV